MTEIIKFCRCSLICFLVFMCTTTCNSIRLPRNILPSDDSRTQLVMGFGIPMALAQESTTLGIVTKFNTILPEWHANTHSTSLGALQRRNTPSRWAVYSILEALLDSLKLGENGHQCLLRAICEAAAVPFDRHSGLSAELLHILFTPSSSNEVGVSQPERDYSAAERTGRQGLAACAGLRGKCSVGLLGFVTRIISWL